MNKIVSETQKHGTDKQWPEERGKRDNGEKKGRD